MARGHQRLENLLIRQAVDRGEIAEETALAWYSAGKKKDKLSKKATVFTGLAGMQARAKADKQKAIMAGAAEQAGMEQEQRIVEQEAERKRQQQQQELLSRYGYSSTIKTSGRGVLGQAPVQYRRLFGA